MVALILVVVALSTGAVRVWYHAGTFPPAADQPQPAGQPLMAGPYVPALDGAGHPAWVAANRVLPAPSRAPLPAALTAVPGSGPVVTAESAHAILAAAWQLRATALAHGDDALFSAFEAGPALEEDLGRCGCNSNPFGAMSVSQVFVAPQGAWPAQFLGEAVTTASGQPWVERLVFRRSGASEPWKVVLASGYQPTGTPKLDIPAAGSRSFDAAEALLPAKLAAYWQSWKDTGAAPPQSGLADGPWTSQFGGERLAPNPQGAVNSSNGLVGRYVYAANVAVDGIFTFAAAGYDIACGTVRDQKTWTSPDAGGAVVQDAASTNWGRDLAPGAYRAVVETDIFEPCFLVQGTNPAVVSGGVEYGSIDLGIS